MPKYWEKQIFTHGRFPEVGQKQKTEKKERGEILQGLRVAQAAVTKCWQLKVDARKSFFFRKKIKIT